MNGLDILTLILLGIFMIIGIWKGFLKIVLRFGAFVLAIVLSKSFGGILGNTILPDLIQSDKLSSSTLEQINSVLATVIGTAVLFLVLLLVFKLLAGILAKLLTKAFHSTKLDRFLGGLVGLLCGCAAVCLIGVLINVYAVAITFINPDSTIFSVIEDTYIFKYFFGTV